MNKITELTRRNIFNLFKCGIKDDVLGISIKYEYKYYGVLTELDFLNTIYELKKLPSVDNYFENAEEEIKYHTIINNDYKNGWIFEDKRFGLVNGDDDVLLKFLCEVFHPLVRDESKYWKKFLDSINEFLREDEYELYPKEQISGNDIYEWKRYTQNFIPYSIRYQNEIIKKQLKLSLPRKIRKNIYELIEKYSETYLESDTTGFQFRITTIECVFRDISKLYKPKCYDEKGEYIETSDIEQFIMSSSPFSVFDVIEIYEKYNCTVEFVKKINRIFDENSIPYKLEEGVIRSNFNIYINKNDIFQISEKGLKELLNEADRYYCEGNMQIAVEKLWDAFERLKTYYHPSFDKPKSSNKIIYDMSGCDSKFKLMYEEEFKKLTYIGNKFRIRHHETDTINITDNRQYDYFYKRCLALISVAILYLEEEQIHEV